MESSLLRVINALSLSYQPPPFKTEESYEIFYGLPTDAAILGMCDFLVDEEHISVIETILKAYDSPFREPLIRLSLSRSKNEECMALYIKYASACGGKKHIDAVKAANIELIGKLMAGAQPPEEWTSLLHAMIMFPSLEAVSFIFDILPPEEEDTLRSLFVYAHNLVPLVEVLRMEGIGRRAREWTKHNCPCLI